jgi:hypothetical protein
MDLLNPRKGLSKKGSPFFEFSNQANTDRIPE